MKGPVDIYVAEMTRAVLGAKASEAKVADPVRLRRIAEHLVQCEDAQAALRAKGYGRSGMSFLEVAREVPTNALGRLKTLFAPKPSAKRHPDLGEVCDVWTAR